MPDPAEPALESDWIAKTLVVAGDGVPGVDDGTAERARFSEPFGVAVANDGTVYITDAGDAHRIRRLAVNGRVDTIAGGARGFRDDAAAAARFDTPSALAIDRDGTLYVADTGNNAIRRVASDGRVTTLAGDGLAGYRDGPGHQARFNGPVGVAVDAAGRVIVADTYNDRIRAIDARGNVSTIAGGAEPGLIDGPPGDARFDTPCGVAVDEDGTVYVADTGNDLVRVIARSGGVSTAPGQFFVGPLRPVGLAAFGQHVYVTDERGRIVELTKSGAGRVLVGSTPGFRDGIGDAAQFRRPSGIAAAAPGRLFVADSGNALVRLIGAQSRLELRPPASPRVAPQFDLERFASQPLLWPVSPMEGPHEIAGTLGEARGGEGSERFHAGIDVRVPEGMPVLALRPSVVSEPLATGAFGSLNEWLRIGPVTYVHLRAGRRPHQELMDLDRFVPTFDSRGRLARIRVKRGARFETGEAIGTVNPFNHVHVNVGWPGEEYNPLRFRLVQFEDSVAPTIERGGVLLYDEQGQALTRREKGRLLISGRVQVVVDAWDQVNGNRPDRRLGLYALGYQVLTADGAPAAGFERARETIEFNRSAADLDAARLVYWPGSGIPFYGGRRTRFLYAVTNHFRGGTGRPGMWDTSELSPGDYTLRIHARDAAGNEATTNRDVAVTVEAR